MRHLLRFDPTAMTAQEATEHVLVAGLTPLAFFPQAQAAFVEGPASATPRVQGLALVDTATA